MPEQIMEHICPQCNRNDMIQKASAIYAAGTSHTTGSVPTDAGYRHISITNRTRLASRCSPPTAKTDVVSMFLKWAVVGFFFIIVVGMVEGPLNLQHNWVLNVIENALVNTSNFFDHLFKTNFGQSAGIAYIPFTFGLISLPSGISNTVWNTTQLPRLNQEWHRTWYCHRCDSTFVS